MRAGRALAGFAWHALLVAAVHSGVRGTSRQLRRTSDRRSGIAASEDPPICDCDCCEVAPRRDDEVVDGVRLKCGPSEKHSADMCPEECMTRDGDQILGPSAAAGGGGLQYIRFCFYECRPLSGARSPVASECIDLDDEEVRMVTADGSGDPRDPAVVLAAAPRRGNRTAALLTSSRTMAAAAAGAAEAAAAAADPRTAKILGRDMKAQAETESQKAREEAAASREFEANKAAKLNAHLKAEVAARKAGGSINPYAAMTDIHKAMQGAEEQARQAGQSLQDALESLQQGRAKAWAAAVSEGQTSMQSVKDEAVAAKAAYDAKHASGVTDVEKQMAEAAGKAAAPYHLSMLRSEQSVKDYTARAEKSASSAVAFEKKAKSLQAKAQGLKNKGKDGAAKAAIEEAQEWMQKAKVSAKQAKFFFATAEQVNKDIPKFSAAAQAAAIRAAYDAQPAWQGTAYGTSMR